ALTAVFRGLSDDVLGTAVSLVFLGSAEQTGNAFDGLDAVAIALQDLPEEWRAAFARGAPADDFLPTGKSSRGVSEDVMRLVLPLSALQSGASLDIVDYIREHIPGSDMEVGAFVHENFVVPLAKGGLSLSAAGCRIAAELRREPLTMQHYDTLVSNGSRIVAFVPPENLMSTTSLGALEKYVSTNFRLIDEAAAMLTAVQSDFAAAKRKASELAAVVNENRNLFQRSNEYHHATLIAYVSQLLMRPRYNLDYTFFRTLETLTLGFCEYLIHHVEPRNDAIYRASRLVTNIGYVYDHLPAGRKRSVQIRKGIFARAATLLEEFTPTSAGDIARYTYAEGWQLWDAGLPERAAEVFLRGAQRLTAETLDVLDAQADPRVFSLLALVYILRNGDMRNDSAHAELERRVRASGIFESLTDLRQYLFGSVHIFDVGRRYFGARPNVAVFFCRYDFPGTLLTVKDFIFRRGLIPRLHLVLPGEPIVMDDPHMLHLIIGSPDTPDGIGDLISRVNPTASYLYQLKSTDDFSDMQVATYEGRTFVSPSGAGFGGDYSEWNQFWSARHASKESTMIDLFFGTLISTIVSSTGEKVTGMLIDGIVDRVRTAVRRLRGTNAADAKDDADVAALRADLQQLPEAVRQKGSDLTSGEAVELLRLDEKPADVAMQVSSLLAPGGLSNIFAQLFAATEVVGSDVYQAREIMEGTLKLAMRLRAMRGLALDEERWLDEYQTGVRTSIAKTNQLAREYEATNEFDDRSFGKLVNNFCNSTRRFAGLMGDIEKRHGIRTDA
ncbi:MAG TPA: hypothetical protein VHX14_15255, partial [Thermoanaerobaculia bacterium]|nr:hypothetical protein [Thermoanaerobaculia bacterium]